MKLTAEFLFGASIALVLLASLNYRHSRKCLHDSQKLNDEAEDNFNKSVKAYGEVMDNVARWRKRNDELYNSMKPSKRLN